MVSQTLDFDLKQTVLIDGSFGPQETQRIAQAVNRDYSQFETLREAIGELKDKESRDEITPAGYVRLGVCLFLTGKFASALAFLKKGDSGALAQFYTAKAHFALKQYPEALEKYEQAQKSRYNTDDCALGKSEVYRAMNDPKRALGELDKLSGAVEQTAEYLYQRGATVAALGENPSEAVALFERAVAADRKWTQAQIDTIVTSQVGNWSRDEGKRIFEDIRRGFC